MNKTNRGLFVLVSLVMVLTMFFSAFPAGTLRAYALAADDYATVEVSTFAQLQAAIDAFNNHGARNTTIVVTDPIDVTSRLILTNQNYTLTLTGETLSRGGNNFDLLALYYGTSLTLKNITLDGKKSIFANEEPLVDTSLVQIIGTLTMEDGAVLKNNNCSRNNYDGGVRVGGTFIMNGGEISGNIAYNGGGVWISPSGTFTMNGGTICDNTADYRGGGVCVEDGKFIMNGGEISGNTAISGGGVYVYVESGKFTMNGGEISGNAASSGGGVVVLPGSTFTMEGGKIFDNTSARYGGGVFADGKFTMNGGEISGNTATENGGGVGIGSSGTFTMEGGKIFDNTSVFEGGGVYANGKFTMNGGEISGNIATENGGGIYVEWYYGSFTMNGGAIFSNAAECGSGVYNDYSYAPVYNRFKMTGGLIFGRGDSADAVVYPSTWSLSGNAVVIRCDSDDELHVMPQEATAQWDTRDGAVGITYENGTNTGFISLETDKTLLTAGRLNFMIPVDHEYTGNVQGIGSVTCKEAEFTAETGGTITVLYDRSTTPPTNAGIYKVTAEISGGTKYKKISVTLGNYTIHPRPLMVTPDAGQCKTYGSPDPTLTYTLSSQLFSSDSMTGTLSRASSETVGSYAYKIGTLSAGDNYKLTLSGTNTFAITKATPKITLAAVLGSGVQAGENNVTLTVTAAKVGTGAMPTGTVIFYSGDMAIQEVRLGISGTCSTVVTLPEGSHTLTATYTGNTNYNSASDSIQDYNVSKKDPVGITVAPATASINVGATTIFAATVTPDDTTDKTVTWTAFPADIVTLTASGEKVTVKGVKAGVATITAKTTNGKTATSTVTVTAVTPELINVNKITVTPATAVLVQGKSTTLKVTVNPDNAANKGVTWITSDASIATVDANGKVTAKGSGVATLTATAKDGSGVKGAAKITVHSYVTLRIGYKNAVLNGAATTIDTAGTKPFKTSGRAMVPIRFVSEKMGAKVKYVNDKAPIIVTYGTKKVEFTLNSKTITITEGGGKPTTQTIDVAAQKKNGKTYIPLRAIGQALGFTVYYDSKIEVIVVNSLSMSASIRNDRIAEGKKLITK